MADTASATISEKDHTTLSKESLDRDDEGQPGAVSGLSDTYGNNTLADPQEPGPGWDSSDKGGLAKDPSSKPVNVGASAKPVDQVKSVNVENGEAQGRVGGITGSASADNVKVDGNGVRVDNARVGGFTFNVGNNKPLVGWNPGETAKGLKDNIGGAASTVRDAVTGKPIEVEGHGKADRVQTTVVKDGVERTVDARNVEADAKGSYDTHNGTVTGEGSARAGELHAYGSDGSEAHLHDAAVNGRGSFNTQTGDAKGSGTANIGEGFYKDPNNEVHIQNGQINASGQGNVNQGNFAVQGGVSAQNLSVRQGDTTVSAWNANTGFNAQGQSGHVIGGLSNTYAGAFSAQTPAGQVSGQGLSVAQIGAGPNGLSAQNIGLANGSYQDIAGNRGQVTNLSIGQAGVAPGDGSPQFNLTGIHADQIQGASGAFGGAAQDVNIASITGGKGVQVNGVDVGALQAGSARLNGIHLDQGTYQPPLSRREGGGGGWGNEDGAVNASGLKVASGSVGPAAFQNLGLQSLDRGAAGDLHLGGLTVGGVQAGPARLNGISLDNADLDGNQLRAHGFAFQSGQAGPVTLRNGRLQDLSADLASGDFDARGLGVTAGVGPLSTSLGLNQLGRHNGHLSLAGPQLGGLALPWLSL